MDAGWLLDELAHAGAEHLDPDFVAAYDRKQGHPDPEPDITAFTARGADRNSTIIDLGAGTGQFALEAARHFGRVIAVDVSPVMLSRLHTRASDAGLSNIECIQGGFLTFELAGDPVDGVFTRNALHQLPDFFKALALRRIADMIRPGGVLRLQDLVYDFDPVDASNALEDWFDHAATDPALGYTRDDLAEHVRSEFSTFRWLLEPMLIASGFEIQEVDFRRRVYGTFTCIKTGGV